MKEKLRQLPALWNTWFLYFLAFAFVGWLYEVCVFYFELGYGFVNRGFCFGPYLPIYGIGGMLLLVTVGPLKRRRVSVGPVSITPLLCFLAICLLTTALELFSSYLTEAIYHIRLWDYSDYGPNFDGRIALRSTLRFGVMGMVGLYLIHPAMERLTGFFRRRFPRGYRLVSYLIIAVFLADLIYHMVCGSNYAEVL